jgi:hypothetical protein
MEPSAFIVFLMKTLFFMQMRLKALLLDASTSLIMCQYGAEVLFLES